MCVWNVDCTFNSAGNPELHPLQFVGLTDADFTAMTAGTYVTDPTNPDAYDWDWKGLDKAAVT